MSQPAIDFPGRLPAQPWIGEEQKSRARALGALAGKSGSVVIRASTVHRVTLGLLYLSTIAAASFLTYVGGPYYVLPLTERAQHPLHALLRPDGIIGHGLGIVGSALMLLLLLYSVRKRFRFLHEKGNIAYWMNYHIWAGITGPVLVVFHTAGKLGGIVSIAFWYMIGIVISGFVGRHLYLQIPRSISGQELSARELKEMELALRHELLAECDSDDEAMAIIDAASSEGEHEVKGRLASLRYSIEQDMMLTGRLRIVRERLRTQGRHSTPVIEHVISLVRKRVKLRRRIALLSTTHELLHHWHIFHRPLAIAMLVIGAIHVAVALAFGCHWIFGPVP